MDDEEPKEWENVETYRRDSQAPNFFETDCYNMKNSSNSKGMFSRYGMLPPLSQYRSDESDSSSESERWPSCSHRPQVRFLGTTKVNTYDVEDSSSSDLDYTQPQWDYESLLRRYPEDLCEDSDV
jgi:hypothetical protein